MHIGLGQTLTAICRAIPSFIKDICHPALKVPVPFLVVKIDWQNQTLEEITEWVDFSWLPVDIFQALDLFEIFKLV